MYSYKNFCVYFTHLPGSPLGGICIKFCVTGPLTDLITHAKFYLNRVRGFDSVGLWGSNFLLSHKKEKSPLTQGLNYRSACDMAKGGHGERAERERRAYNGSQRAELPAGSRGRDPGRGVRGAKPPLKLKHFLLLNVQWKPQIRPFFWNFETQKTIKHCWILQVLLENGKKRTFSYKVACKKLSWSGQGGGHRTVPP